MRFTLATLTAVLLLIALAGLIAGIVIVIIVAKQPSTDPLRLALAVIYGSIPFAIGTIALGAVTVVVSVQHASSEQVAATSWLLAAVNRGTDTAAARAQR